MRKKDYVKFGTLIIFLIVTFLSILLLKPFSGPIIMSILLSFMLHPLYRFILKYVKNKNIAAGAMCLIVILTLFIPFLFLLNYIVKQAPGIYLSLSGMLKNLSHNDIEIFIAEWTGLDVNIAQFISGTTAKLLIMLQGIVIGLPNKVLNFVLTLFFMFYLFRDGHLMAQKVIQVLPFREKDKSYLISQVKNVSKGVIYGQLFTAIAQGFVATIGYVLIGIGSPIIFGLFTFFLCLIPFFGAYLAYTPVSVYLILYGLSTDEMGIMIRGIVLLIYGSLVISTVDNFIKPYIVSSQTNIHPALMVLSVLGGLFAFGVLGIVLGPLVLVLFFSLIKLYGNK